MNISTVTIKYLHVDKLPLLWWTHFFHYMTLTAIDYAIRTASFLWLFPFRTSPFAVAVATHGEIGASLRPVHVFDCENKMTTIRKLMCCVKSTMNGIRLMAVCRRSRRPSTFLFSVNYNWGCGTRMDAAADAWRNQQYTHNRAVIHRDWLGQPDDSDTISIQPDN